MRLKTAETLKLVFQRTVPLSAVMFFSDPANKSTSCFFSSLRANKALDSFPTVMSPRHHPVYTGFQIVPRTSSPYPKIPPDIRAKLCLIPLLSLHPKGNMRWILRICLLKVHAPSFLMNSLNVPCPLHQYESNFLSWIPPLKTSLF